MKALTLHQPWASLVALGVKTIETRSWSTKYRGPLAIHAGATRPPLMHLPPLSRGRTDADREHDEQTWLVVDTITDDAYKGPQPQGRRIPKRATTPTLFWPHAGPHARLVGEPDHLGHRIAHTEYLPLGAVVATCTLVDVVPIDDLTWGGSVEHGWAPPCGDGYPRCHGHVAADQRPYGDFTPGRFAWLLDDVKPTTERCPACCGAGGEPVPTAWGSEVPRHRRCSTCAGRGRCDPIPARGRQGLWEWTP